MTKNSPLNVGMHPGASDPNPLPPAPSSPQSDAPACGATHSLPKRKTPRADFHDYSGGDYFVTICTRDKLHYFGEIVDDEMRLTEIGKCADDAMRNLATHYDYVEVPLYVVMPNHIHAIICIHEPADAPGRIPAIRTALGVVVGGYKQAVTRFARRNNIEFGLQDRYHDHIIRGTHDGNKIAEYINNNVATWASDLFS